MKNVGKKCKGKQLDKRGDLVPCREAAYCKGYCEPHYRQKLRDVSPDGPQHVQRRAKGTLPVFSRVTKPAALRMIKAAGLKNYRSLYAFSSDFWEYFGTKKFAERFGNLFQAS